MAPWGPPEVLEKLPASLLASAAPVRAYYWGTSGDNSKLFEGRVGLVGAN